MKYCCSVFNSMLDEAGADSTSMVVIKEDNTFLFALQCRVIYDNKNKESVIQQGILYCPWCGKKLSDLAKSHSKEFEVIAANHKKYLLDFSVSK